MIDVSEVVTDPDFTAPQPFTIKRSTGQFVLGGFESVTTDIPQLGPVQQASDKEIQMLPEADRVGSIRSFWCTIPIYTTRGTAPVPSVHGETPVGSGTNYTLSEAPPNNAILLYSNGKLLRPNGADYTLSGTTLTFNSPPQLPIYATWEITAEVGTNAADIIVYGNEEYRLLRTYCDPGSGYWKAYGTRMNAA